MKSVFMAGCSFPKIPTYGSRAATSFLTSIEPSILNSRGDIKVNSHLQVDHHSLPNVFAVGNAVDWDEQKQGTSTLSLLLGPVSIGGLG